MRKSPTIQWSIGTKDQHGGLFPLALSVDAYVLPRYNAARLSIGNFAILFEPNAVTYFMVEREWKRVSRAYFARVQKNPAIAERLFTDVRTSSRALLQCSKIIGRKPIEKLTNTRLIGWYDRYIAALRRVYYYGLVTTFLDFNDDLYVTDVLMKIIRAHHIPPESQGTVFATLTTPTERWDATDAEERIDAMIASILASQKILELFSSTNRAVTPAGLKHVPSFVRKVRAFQADYAWLNYGFEGPLMTVADVLVMLQERLQHLGYPVEGVLERHRTVVRQQRTMIKQYQLNSNEQRWFTIGRTLAFSKSYRRLHQSHSYALMDALFGELARRSSTSVRLWKMLKPQEVHAVLLKGAPLPADLSERRNYCVYGRNKQQTFLFTGAQARDMAQPILKRAGEGTLAIFQGQVAYPGVVEGIARVIRTPSDLHNIPEHSIIVSPSLNPRMQLAMNRASAIVTDAGGLTCHAAVVSRELKIPCIVGAKNASEHIRTGNRVLVDAQRGIVTLLAQ